MTGGLPPTAGTIASRRGRRRLRAGYGWTILALMTLQLAAADGGFFWYCHANDWRVPASAIQVWIAGSVVQVVGVAAVIARGIFATPDE